MIFMSDRLSVAFSFSRRAHLLTTCKAGGGIPPVGQARALFTKRLLAAFPEGAGNVASEHSLCSRLYILHYQQNDEVAYCHPIPAIMVFTGQNPGTIPIPQIHHPSWFGACKGRCRSAPAVRLRPRPGTLASR